MSLCDKVKMMVEQGWKLIDVREPSEYVANRITGAVNVRLSEVQELPSEHKYLLYCRSGSRSHMANMILIGKGVDSMNLGGINSYSSCIE